jgi:hypothetical protein
MNDEPKEVDVAARIGPAVMSLVDLTCASDSVLSLYQSNEQIVSIHPDGRIEINPKYTTDEAAKAFWEAVIRMNPFQPETARGAEQIY